MDFIAPDLPELVEQYLQDYDDLFHHKEQRRQYRYYVAGLLSETKRKNIESMVKKVIEQNYQPAQNFLSVSPWDEEALNQRRLERLQGDPLMRMRSDGWLVQDDTGQERHVGGTDGVARQYIGNVGKVSEGLVVVTTHYADPDKHWSLYADLYWPKAALQRLPSEDQTPRRQRDKIGIALDHLRQVKVLAGAGLRRVLADPWYGSNPRYLTTIHDELQWHYVVAIKGNRVVFDQLPGERSRPEHATEELMTLFKAEDYQPVSVRRAEGSLETVWAVERRTRLKGVRHPVKLVVQVDNPKRPDPEKTRFLVTDELAMRREEVVQSYALRNWGEVFYRESKDDLGWDQAEVRTEKRLKRHWVLVMLVHTMVQELRLHGRFGDWTTRPPRSFGDAFRALQDVFRWTFWNQWLRCAGNLERFITWWRVNGRVMPQTV